MKSFRVRILAGSFVWTIAILSASHMLFQLVVFHSFPMRHRVILATALLGMAAGALIISSALSPFRQLRSQLLELRDGHRSGIAGDYATEVQPLIDDLNRLLVQRERAVEHAQAKAGDLAHGLKTPLAVLTQEADRAKREGQAEFAETLIQQVEKMRRQVEYHLAESRTGFAPGPGVRCSVNSTVEALTRTLTRLHNDRQITLDVNVREVHAVRLRCQDLEEILGNVLDNAFKWCNGRISVSSEQDGEVLRIIVEDNGPGITTEMRDIVLQRGSRLDETTAGSGLGLAITAQVVRLYGGRLSLDESKLGGLAVNVFLPNAGEAKL